MACRREPVAPLCPISLFNACSSVMASLERPAFRVEQRGVVADRPEARFVLRRVLVERPMQRADVIIRCDPQKGGSRVPVHERPAWKVVGTPQSLRLPHVDALAGSPHCIGKPHAFGVRGRVAGVAVGRPLQRSNGIERASRPYQRYRRAARPCPGRRDPERASSAPASRWRRDFQGRWTRLRDTCRQDSAGDRRHATTGTSPTPDAPADRRAEAHR
jgi:hypothetical protein